MLNWKKLHLHISFYFSLLNSSLNVFFKFIYDAFWRL
jgi:hypothetical protein